ncbi:bifunctional oligoribonuclease/PAP phosphatase NrnA [candidate division KSB1 bacterium]|nr:bifunctional oligoribonuclease/PAP phosphatase NrnA [candidate division KSB1 bacterium]
MIFSEAALAQIQTQINSGKNFIITTHVNPDGDGLGSEIALAHYLRQLGKRVQIFNHSLTPPNYEFLDPLADIQIFDTARDRHAVEDSDAVFILDISDWKRLRDLGTLIRPLRIAKICIDHHPLNEPFADLDVIYPRASSTGEMIFELLTRLGARIEGRIAQALYTAIMTDTGGFRFSNTTPNAHQVSAALIGNGGVQPHLIYQKVFETQPPQRMKLLAQILADLHFEEKGQIVWFIVTRDMLNATGTQPHDTEGFADFPRTIDGVQLCLMFLETKDGKVKISFRSKGKHVINGLASRFGGGGHPFAAGAVIEGAMPDVVPMVVDEARTLFS